ncbi:MAG: alpha/beta hydrolase [Ignavibacteriales bacterium]|nr:alpha/beta hydrolase [Ignavibacteriales bacterium]
MFRILLASFIFLGIIKAQEINMKLWETAIPNYQKTDEVELSEYVDGITKISYVQEPDITVYLPSKANSTGDAVVICPGGGYKILAYDWEGSDIAKFFNSKGIAAIVLKYRLPVSKSNIIPDKSPLMDAQRAIRLTRFHAEEWGIEQNKIGIIGFSAGGHLASTAGTHFDLGVINSSDPIEELSSRPDFMILVYPVISFIQPYSHSGSVKNLLGENPSEELLKYYSNELHVTNQTPPTILIHSQDDTTVPIENSLSFYKALCENNVKAEMHTYTYGGHGFSLAIGKGYLSTWTERVMDWINNLGTEKK